MVDPGSKDARERTGEQAPPPPRQSPFTGIAVTIVVVILAVVAIAFIAGAFTSEDIGGGDTAIESVE